MQRSTSTADGGGIEDHRKIGARSRRHHGRKRSAESKVAAVGAVEAHASGRQRNRARIPQRKGLGHARPHRAAAEIYAAAAANQRRANWQLNGDGGRS